MKSIVSGTYNTTRTSTKSEKLAPNKLGRRKGYLNVAEENGRFRVEMVENIFGSTGSFSCYLRLDVVLQNKYMGFIHSSRSYVFRKPKKRKQRPHTHTHYYWKSANKFGIGIRGNIQPIMWLQSDKKYIFGGSDAKMVGTSTMPVKADVRTQPYPNHHPSLKTWHNSLDLRPEKTRG